MPEGVLVYQTNGGGGGEGGGGTGDASAVNQQTQITQLTTLIARAEAIRDRLIVGQAARAGSLGVTLSLEDIALLDTIRSLIDAKADGTEADPVRVRAAVLGQLARANSHGVTLSTEDVAKLEEMRALLAGWLTTGSGLVDDDPILGSTRPTLLGGYASDEIPALSAANGVMKPLWIDRNGRIIVTGTDDAPVRAVGYPDQRHVAVAADVGTAYAAGDSLFGLVGFSGVRRDGGLILQKLTYMSQKSGLDLGLVVYRRYPVLSTPAEQTPINNQPLVITPTSAFITKPEIFKLTQEEVSVSNGDGGTMYFYTADLGPMLLRDTEIGPDIGVSLKLNAGPVSFVAGDAAGVMVLSYLQE